MQSTLCFDQSYVTMATSSSEHYNIPSRYEHNSIFFWYCGSNVEPGSNWIRIFTTDVPRSLACAVRANKDLSRRSRLMSIARTDYKGAGNIQGFAKFDAWFWIAERGYKCTIRSCLICIMSTARSKSSSLVITKCLRTTTSNSYHWGLKSQSNRYSCLDMTQAETDYKIPPALIPCTT